MQLRSYWCIREDQWGTDSIEVRNGVEVYNTYEDRKEGSYTEIYLGDLHDFVDKYATRDESAYQEAVAYIKENYLKK